MPVTVVPGRAAIIAISEPPEMLKNLPFDMLEFIEHLDELPWEGDTSGLE